MSNEYRAYYHTVIGLIEVSGNEDGIKSVNFSKAQEQESAVIHPSLQDCITQLDEYFKGSRKSFALSLNPAGTEFQKKVWRQLQKIPFGQTVSYLDIANSLGDAGAVRAVGSANGKNPIAIIVPCHRVIGRNGKLIGYGGGVWRKEWLLRHEKAII